MSRAKTKRRIPNPGTRAAEQLGCTCPIVDNEYGRGWMGQKNVFVYTMGCPVHHRAVWDPAHRRLKGPTKGAE